MAKTRGRGAGRGGRGMRGGPVATYSVGWWIAGQVIAAIWRFCAGQVVLRRPGRWDSRWLTWAAPLPEHVELSRDEGVPRTKWARRPGWHRQAARFGAIALLVGMTCWSTITVVVTVAAIAVVGVRRAIDFQDLAYYHRVCGNFLEWTAGRIGWDDMDDDPRSWIELPPRSVEWVPVAPLRVLVARWSQTGDGRVGDVGDVADAGRGDVDDDQGDEHATSEPRPREPARARIARWVAPLTTQVGEWRMVAWLTESREGRPHSRARRMRAIGRRIVQIGEATRRIRVRPRLVVPDLAAPESTITIRYPSSYQAHGQDISEIERVVASRLPGGPWKFRHNADDLSVTVYHPETLPRMVKWTLEVFEQYGPLELPVAERTGKRRVTVDLKGQTPHVNVAGKTGYGKTVTFLLLAAGFLYHGSRIVLVDPKRIGFIRALRRLSNVDLITVPERFPQTFADVEIELERRYQIIEKYAEQAAEMGLPPMEENAEMYFQPLAVFTDEKSGFAAICKSLWKKDRGDGKPGTGPHPAIEQERNIVARGRQACIYSFAAAQQNAIPQVFPDTDIRGNYQYKILAGPSDPSGWLTTFGYGEKMKKVPLVKGRGIMGVGTEIFEAQLAFMDVSDVRAAAEHGESIQDAVNLQRAQRLSAISGLPLWEVSPLPWWVPVPASTGVDVHGPADGMDTGAPVVIDAEPAPAAPLTLVKNNGQESPAQDVAESAEGVDDDTIGGTPEANARSIVEGAGESNARSESVADGDQFQGPATGPETIKGNRAAAEYLGVSFDAFRKARSRAEDAGEPIPGMERDGRFVTFDPVQLAEWWNQRPGSGRKAS